MHSPHKHPETEKWLSRSEVLATTTIGSTFVPVKGEGVYLWDPDGRKVIDFTSFIGVCNLGHGKDVKRIRDAVRKHEDETGLNHKMTHDWVNIEAVELAEKLCEITPGNHEKRVFFSSTGTEANEAAVKILLNARPERKRFLSFINAFHGRTGYVLPLMGSKPIHVEGFPLAYTVHHFPFPEHGNTPMDYIDSIRRYFETAIPPHEVNAIFIEFVQGEGGIRVADPDLLNLLIDLCTEFDIKIVDDEIQAGFGRCGKMFASDHYEIVPNITTHAKCIAAGLGVLGATVFDAELDFGGPGRHSNTFGGNTSACVAALENIQIIQELLSEEDSQNRQHHFLTTLKDTISAINQKSTTIQLSEVRGKGWMLGADILIQDSKTHKDFKEDSIMMRDKVVECAEEWGLLLAGCGKSAVRFMPPITISNDEVSKALEIFRNLPVWDE